MPYTNNNFSTSCFLKANIENHLMYIVGCHSKKEEIMDFLNWLIKNNKTIKYKDSFIICCHILTSLSPERLLLDKSFILNCIKEGNLDITRIILKKSENIIFFDNFELETALEYYFHTACTYGRIDIVRYMCDYNFDIISTEIDPVSLSFHSNHLNITSYLLSQPAFLNVFNKNNGLVHKEMILSSIYKYNINQKLSTF